MVCTGDKQKVFFILSKVHKFMQLNKYDFKDIFSPIISSNGRRLVGCEEAWAWVWTQDSWVLANCALHQFAKGLNYSPCQISSVPALLLQTNNTIKF